MNEEIGAEITKSLDNLQAPPVREQRETGEVRRLILKGVVDVVWFPCSTPRVVVAADDAAWMEQIETKHAGGDLVVAVKSGSGTSISVSGSNNIVSTGDITEYRAGSADVRINMRGTSVHIKGGANRFAMHGGRSITIIGDNVRIAGGDIGGLSVSVINLPGRCVVFLLQPKAPDVVIRGSGNVRLLRMDQDAVALLIEGSGNIEAHGQVERLDACISGSGEIKAKGLAAKTAICRVDGSGDIGANVSQYVKGRVNGSGGIRIHGNPLRRDTVVHGSGGIKVKP